MLTTRRPWLLPVLGGAVAVSAVVAGSRGSPDPSGRFLAVADYANDEVLVFDTDVVIDGRRPVVARFGWADRFGSPGFSFSSVVFY